ncbi:MAG: DUF2520 domain-containing protein [Fervidobacterium sp.]
MLINIVGVGKVSSSIARQLKGKVSFGFIVSRDFLKAQNLAFELSATPVSYQENFTLNGITLLGLNDSVLPKAKELLIGKVGEITALHFSGFHPSTILPKEWKPASMHPNCAVSNEWYSFKNVVFGIEGWQESVKLAMEVVEILGGKSVIIPTVKKPLYHLAAVISSNFPMALVYMSLLIYKELGINDETGRKIISELLGSVRNNINKCNLKDALTGPVKRKDFEVVEKEKTIFKEFFEKYEISTQLYNHLIKILQKITEEG